jgi:hypothetical protein
MARIFKLIIEYYRYSRSIAAPIALPGRYCFLPRKAGISDLPEISRSLATFLLNGSDGEDLISSSGTQTPQATRP